LENTEKSELGAFSGIGGIMLLVVEGERAVLRSRTTPEILLLLPHLEGRRRWTDEGLSFLATAHNLELVSGRFPSLIVEGRERPANERSGPGPLPLPPEPAIDALARLYGPGNGPSKVPLSFPYRRKPDDHQFRALRAMAGQTAFGLFMEQGTGKTKTVVDWTSALYRAGDITGMLVVTKKGVHRQWVEEHGPKDFWVEWSGQWWNGKPIHPYGPGLQVLTVNYDALRSAKTLALVEAFCKSHNGKLLIAADESQEIKNHRSQRHKAMMKLRPYSSHRVIMTGTPIAKDLTDEWSQMLWLDETILGMRDVTTFRSKYCVMGGFGGHAVIGHRNMEEFKERTAPYVFRATKDELGLLPKAHDQWKFDLTKRQKDMMRELKTQLATQLDSGEVVDIIGAAQALTKAQQISNGFVQLEDNRIERLMPVMENPRALAMLEWLEAGEGKAIVWCRFREDVRIVCEALGESNVRFVEHHGGNNATERKASLDAFIDGEAQVIVATAATMGTGVDGLQKACTRNLYYSNSFNAIDRWQSEDRTHRKGAVGRVTYTDLIAKGGLDLYVLNNLWKKEATASERLSDLRASLEE
jgi:hypothetical protein